MPITLTRNEIDAALRGLGSAVEKYTFIQSCVHDKKNGLLVDSEEFKRRFNGYYRVSRKSQKWYQSFYTLFDDARLENKSFSEVLEELHTLTNSYEASFCSKMVASIDPNMPVIDSIVLKHLGLKLPYSYERNRHTLICSIYNGIAACYTLYLSTPTGKYLIKAFKEQYPRVNLTNTKMLDFVIWKHGNTR